MSICVERNPGPERLRTLGVEEWPLWTHEAATFPWTYDAEERCYFLEGDVTVTPEQGDPVTVGAGDLVTFSQGMRCTWEIHVAVKKHYRFG